MRRLPGYEAVAAARAAMNDAKVAHEHVHRADALLEMAEAAGALPDGADDLLAELAARWPAFDVQGPTLERLRAIRTGLVPAAADEHEREHALERLLFDQYHALLDDAEWADVKAVLEPLYAERTEMFGTLSTAYHAVVLRRAGDDHLSEMRSLCPVPGARNYMSAPIALYTTQTIVESLMGTLTTFGIETPPPTPPAVADEVIYVEYLAVLDAWVADERASTAAIGAEVDRQLARWNEINRQIEAHTG